MAEFRKIFPKPTTILTVIHAESAEQTLRNADIAFSEGADGIFLNNHIASIKNLLEFYEVVRAKHEKEWIGLNFSRHPTASAIGDFPKTASGLWVDDARIDETDPLCMEARSLLEKRSKDPIWEQALYFGGIASKYQKAVDNPDRAARFAMPFVDVVTTSGEITGSIPPLKRIKKMRQAMGKDMPFAITSGTNHNSVLSYLQFVDVILVTQDVSKASFVDLNPRPLARFMKHVNQAS